MERSGFFQGMMRWIVTSTTQHTVEAAIEMVFLHHTKIGQWLAGYPPSQLTSFTTQPTITEMLTSNGKLNPQTV